MVSARSKRRNGAVISLIVGPLLAALGVLFLFFNDQVRCDGEVMQPGDYCEVTARGRTYVQSYEEHRDYWTRMGWIGAGAGVFFAGYGVWSLRALKRETAVPVVGGPPPR